MVEARGQAGFQHTSGMEVVPEVAEVSILPGGLKERDVWHEPAKYFITCVTAGTLFSCIYSLLQDNGHISNTCCSLRTFSGV